MNLIKLCMDRPVGVAVGVLLVVLFGVLSLFAIPVQLTPNVDVPVITIRTMWSGASPQEIEREIVEEQEEMLRSVKSLRKMTSQSQENMATVTLELYPHAEMSEVLRDVNEKLRQVPAYPVEVDEPVIYVGDSEMGTIIAWLVMSEDAAGGGAADSAGARGADSATVGGTGPAGSGGSESATVGGAGSVGVVDVRELRDFAEDYVKPYIDRVPGVASSDIYGGLEREIQIKVDAGELASRGVTFAQLRSALQRQNENISAGSRTQGKRDYTIRTVGKFESLEEISSTVIAYSQGGPVYVRDVASVERSFKKPEGLVRSNGRWVLAFPIRREVGANVMKVMEGIREAVRRVNEEVLKGRGLKIDLTQVYDETVYITQAIDMVQSNIVYGSAFVLGLLLAFLRSWRATAVLALTIPVSIVGTFAIIVALGRTLNVVSLAGIAFAVGDVVDSAYVVLENVFRHKQMGKSVREAVIEGTQEVWGAVLASTLTTMAVFVPVIFISEEAGQLFRDISIAEVVAVGLSMIVAVTVIPPLAARLLKQERGAPKFAADDELGGVRGAAGAGAKRDVILRTAGVIAGVVDRLNGARALRAVVIVVMTAGSLWLARLLVPDTTYLPAGNRNLVFGFLLTPPGYSIEEFTRMSGVIEERIRPYWEARGGTEEMKRLDEEWRSEIEGALGAGQIAEVNNPGLSYLERSRARREWLNPPPAVSEFFFVAFQGSCFMGAISADATRVKPLVNLLNRAGMRVPGAYPFFFQSQLFSFGGGNSAEVQIRGEDLEKVTRAAEAMQMACMGRFGFPQANPSNFNLGRPELRIVPHRERAANLGVDVTDIGLIVEACGDGAYIGDYRGDGSDTIDITLLVAGQRERPPQEIAQVPMYSAFGGSVPLNTEAERVAARMVSGTSGRVIPLSAVVELVDTTSLEQINHIERQRSVTLTINPPESMALEGVIRQIREEIEPELRKSGEIDASVQISLTGNADKLAAARNSLMGEWKGWTVSSVLNVLSGRFFLSVLIVYLLMCALYESWLYPFVIMFSVPLAILGGFLGLSAAHWGTLLTTNQPVQQLDVLTFLGFVMLVGLVVKNAILLVEQALVHIREHEMGARAAVSEAVRTRFRPVLMTSLTSVVGQLPLAVLPGAGSELYRGLASVMVGGMIVSAAGTLVLVPCVLSVVLEWRERWGARHAHPIGVVGAALLESESEGEDGSGTAIGSATTEAVSAREVGASSK